ncbi:MAG: histidine phosphatase family protein, partial [Deltaproteobacteria bacterium]
MDALLIRHGQSTWNAAGRWQGQGDPPLSDAGRRQARALAGALAAARARFDALLSSDLARARETAAILGEALSLEPEIEPRLRERNVGSWSGRTRREIERSWPEELARVRAGD